jgi:arsenical-resistance protein
VILQDLGLITPEAARYLWTGLILLGVAPCIAMVLVWTDLAKGNGPLGIVLMAWNSIIQVITTPFYIALLVGTYIAIDILLIGQSVLLYLGLPLMLGVLTRSYVIKNKGEVWLKDRLLPKFGAMQLLALLFTMVVMFSLKGGVILDNPNLIWQMAIPVVLFFFLLYNLVFYTCRRFGYNYEDSSTMGFHCTGRNFELAIAIALTAFATMPMVAVSTVVGPLIEGLRVPELVLVEVDPALGRNEPDGEIRDLLKASAGTNLGLDYLPGSVTFDPIVGPPPDAETASRLVLFDAFVTNVDRTPRNPNVLLWHRRVWLIDHGAALYFHHGWSAADRLDGSRDPFTEVRQHVLLPWASALGAAAAHLGAVLTEPLFARVVAAIPASWETPRDGFADAGAMRAAYLAWLRARAEALPIFLEEAERARAERV